jgi:transcription initiation factor TFIID subunit TAF12
MAIAAGITFAGASVVQGERQERAQRQSIRAQQQAQDQALSAAAKQQRQAEMAEKAATARKPNRDDLLAEESTRSLTGASSTFLTGVDGAGKGLLGRPSLLGG